jgi:hypothetical protein
MGGLRTPLALMATTFEVLDDDAEPVPHPPAALATAAAATAYPSRT